ncbi:hypothetical protein ACFPES_06235 [Paenibacillus sp. GCM10023248]|uniref:hypothetical protein n=1 Tax=unclassified Paenibacillus TaxID=185978 RepID=UPI00237972BA|nr:hypothetical protein [Paenibacillus sp. MAHUQ-63]MDD9266627.1 hypothetical protein [Paenibacillus sp. MAHUQ-63]
MLEMEYFEHRGGIKLPKPAGTCADWMAYFDKQYGKSKVYNAYSVEELYNRAWRQLNQLADDWEPTIRGIYDILVALYLKQLVDALVDSKRDSGGGAPDFFYQAGYYFAKIAKHSQDQLTSVLEKIDNGKAQRAYRARLQELAAYAAEQFAKETVETVYRDWSWFNIHKLLWSGLLNEKSLIADELVRLRQAAANSGPGQARDAAVKSLAHFDLMAGDDENAWDRIAAMLKEIDPRDWLGYLEDYVRAQQWNRLLKWLEWLRPVIRDKAQDFTMAYLDLWQEAVNDVEVEGAFREAMVSLLPSSYGHYSRFLLDKEEYRAWADLHLLLGYTPASIESAQLKKVEKADPPVLLPIYHYAVEMWMGEKTRLGYKEAVKLLKKLEAVYKKLRMAPRFESYLAELVKKSSRYRAFQAELHKGGLLR